MIRHLIIGIVPLMLHVSAPWCWAGFDEGANAYARGDYPTAMREWLPLAQQGDTYAQYGLGLMYYKGHGVPQDYGQAAQWFRRVADHGHAEAQAALGLMYALGRGVPQDVVQAYLWLTLAAARLPPGTEHDDAVRARDTVAQGMTPAQLAQGQERARTWQPKPETSGDRRAAPHHDSPP